MHERLKLARRNAGFRSAAQAARKFGWNTSRYRAHENGQNPFKIAHAEDYGRAFKCSAAWLLTGLGFHSNLSVFNASFSVGAEAISDPSQNVSFPLMGPACAGLWKDMHLMGETIVANRRLGPIDARYPREVQFDVEILGDGINQIAVEGSLLRCVDLRKLRLDLNDGDLVVIERQNQQGLIEISVRQVRINGNMLELLHATDNPRLSSQVIVVDEASQQPKINIIGKVLWSYKNF